MKFVLTINCDSDAFIDDPDLEVAAILEGIITQLKDDGLEKNPTILEDSNGMTVGSVEFVNDLSLDDDD